MILILGSGRSGTTFLAKLFDSHPRVLYRHEPDWLLVGNSIPFQPRLDELERYRDQTSRYLDSLAQVRSPKVSVHLPLFHKQYRSPARQRLQNGFALAAKTLARLPGLEHRMSVPDLVDAAAPRPVTVIKSVNSLNRARLFLAAKPELRILHIVRHPCGVVASQLRGAEKRLMKNEVFFDSLYRMENVAKYGLARDEMARRTLEEQLAFQWMVTNDSVLGEMAGAPGYRLMRYEDLCLDTGAVVDDLFSFCGLQKNAQTDRFVHHLEGQESGSAAYFSVVRSPRKAMFKWKAELKSEQMAQVDEIAGRSDIGSLYTADDCRFPLATASWKSASTIKTGIPG